MKQTNVLKRHSLPPSAYARTHRERIQDAHKVVHNAHDHSRLAKRSNDENVNASTYASSLTGYTNPTICLELNQGILFDLADGHYPVYIKDSLLSTNADFDYGAFRELDLLISSNVTEIAAFGFTFSKEGTYVFGDSVDNNKQTIITVMMEHQVCSTESKILPSTSGNMVSSGVAVAVEATIAPDLSTIFTLVITFACAVVLVGIMARLKQFRALRAELQLDNETEQIKGKFLELYQEMKLTGRKQEEMFEIQQESFDAQTKKILADLVQLKALIGVKSGRGFIDAAVRLVLMETEARSSFASRQARRVVQIVDQAHSFKTALSERVKHAEKKVSSNRADLKSKQVNNQIRKVSADIIILVDEVLQAVTEERRRRDNIIDCSGIIDDDIIREMQVHADDEQDVEVVLMSAIQVFKGMIVKFIGNLDHIKQTMDSKFLSPNFSEMARQEAQRQHAQAYVELSKVVLEQTLYFLEGVPEKRDNLAEIRKLSAEDCEHAVTLVNQRRSQLEEKMENNLFEGLSPELTTALKFFLGEAHKTMAETVGANDPEAVQVLPSRSAVAAQQAGAAAAQAEPETNLIEQKIDEYHKQLNNEVDAVEEDIYKQIHGLLIDKNRIDETSEDLALQLSGLRQKRALIETALYEDAMAAVMSVKALFAESGFQLLGEDNRRKLEDAREAIEQLEVKHAQEAEDLAEQSHAECETAYSEVLDDLNTKELEAKMKQDVLSSKLNIDIQGVKPAAREDLVESFRISEDELAQNLMFARKAVRKALAGIFSESHQRFIVDKSRLLASQEAERAPTRQVLRDMYQLVQDAKPPVIVEGKNLNDVRKVIHSQSNGLSERQQAQQKFHLESMRELTKKQTEEARRSNQEFEREMADNKALEEEELQEQIQKALQEKRSELSAKRGNMSGNELNEKALRIYQEYEKLMLANTNMKRAQLQRKNMVAKREKLAQLKRRQQQALADEQAEQQAEKDALVRNMIIDRERKALTELLTGTNKAQDKHVVEEVLGDRHQKEIDQLKHARHVEEAQRIKQALEDAWEHIFELKESLLDKKRNGEIGAAECEASQGRYDAQLQNEQEAIKNRVREEMLQKQRGKIKELKMEHDKEIRKLFKEWHPTESFKGAEWHVQELDLDALREQRENRQREMEQKFADERKLLEAKEEELRANLEAERQKDLIEWEKRYDEEQKAIEIKMRAELETKLKSQAKMRRAELDMAHKEEMRSAKTSAAQKALIQSHKAVLENDAAEAEDDRIRQLKGLEASLAAKKQRALNAELARMKKQREAEEKKRQEDAARKEAELAAAAKAREQEIRSLVRIAASKLMKAGQSRAKHRSKGIALAVRRLKENAEKRIVNMQAQLKLAGVEVNEAAGLAMSAIGAMGEGNENGERLLANMDRHEGVALANGKVDNHVFLERLDDLQAFLSKLTKNQEGEYKPYEEEGESDLKCSGKAPVAKAPEELDAKHFIIYRYAVFVLNFLNAAHSQPSIELRFASSIPQKRFASLYTRNAFRNSFHWDEAARVLYVRMERVSKPGQLTVLLVHVLAHIRAAHWNDDHPRFVAEFMSSFRQLSGEFFFTKVSREALPPRAADQKEKEGRLSFHDVFGLLTSEDLSIDSKEGVVSDLLELTREGLPDGDFSAPDKVFGRLNQFESFARSCHLKMHLQDLESAMGEKMKTLAHETQSSTASSEPPRVKLQSRLEYLHAQSDELHEELLTVVSDMHSISEAIVQAQANNPDHDCSSQQTQLDKLDLQKASLLSRLDALERRRARVKKLLKELA